MSTSFVLELQKAIYSTLSGDATLGALISGVFSHVPQGTVFPYVVMGEGESQDYSTKTSTAEIITSELFVLSRERGAKETLDIMARVKELLHQVSLSLTGCTLVYLRFNTAEITQEKESLTWEGRLTFLALVE